MEAFWCSRTGPPLIRIPRSYTLKRAWEIFRHIRSSFIVHRSSYESPPTFTSFPQYKITEILYMHCGTIWTVSVPLLSSGQYGGLVPPFESPSLIRAVAPSCRTCDWLSACGQHCCRLWEWSCHNTHQRRNTCSWHRSKPVQSIDAAILCLIYYRKKKRRLFLKKVLTHM